MRNEQKATKDSKKQVQQWKFDPLRGKVMPEIDRRFERGGTSFGAKQYRHSHSGHERNRLFFNTQGKKFTDISSVSGMDTPADSRSFVLWDYDHDGWQDIAVVNANLPLLSLYRNQISSLPNQKDSGGGRMIAVRFVGGNETSRASSFAPRDGYGAIVTVSLSDLSLKREHRCGEGFAAQNSATMIVGLGNQAVAKSVSVRWPSGKVQTINNVAAGTLLTVFENPTDAPDGKSFVTRPYRDTSRTKPPIAVENQPKSSIKLLFKSAPISATGGAKLRMYTTMATWCAACTRELPHLAYLRSLFEESQLKMIGLPVDKHDSEKALATYVARQRPVYRMLGVLPPEERSEVEKILDPVAKSPPLPSTIVTDDQGIVLQTFPGVPTASDLRKLLSSIKYRDSSPIE